VYILIDGYNLIGTAHRELEKARNDLIQDLGRYSVRKGHDITLVFDGWKDGRAIETTIRTAGVTVIYSRIGENADFVIKRILSAGERPWIVVSSDREISDFAFGRDYAAITSREFEDKLFASLNSSDQTESGYIDDMNEEDEPSAGQKGNPRRVSKKLRKKLRALERL
jgi:predicted RNA-binding protein with PIN domain